MNSSFLRRFAVCTGVLAASACGDSPTQSTAADIGASVAISRAQFRSGDSTTVITSLVNHGETAIFIADSSCVAYFEVASGSNVVAPGQPICAAVAYAPIALAPGETRQFAEVWHGENRSWQVMLSAGTYSVRSNVMSNVGPIVSTAISVQILP